MTTHAIFIGINHYTDQNFSALTCAENDADELSGLFKRNFGMGEHVKKLIGKKVTTLDLTRYMRGITPHVRSGDRFFFFFSGHGYEHPKRTEQYLLFPEADESLIMQGYYDGELLALSRIMALTERWPAIEQVYVIDACRRWLPEKFATPQIFENADGLAYLVDRAPNRQSGETSTLIINACQNGQAARELESKKRGVMALALEECLNERLQLNKPIWIDSGLMEEVGERMQSLFRDNQLAVEQKPMLLPPTGKVLLYKPKIDVDQAKIEITTPPISTTLSPFIELREQFDKHLSDGDNEGCEYILEIMQAQKYLKYIECKRKWEELTQQKTGADEQAWQIAYASQSIVGYEIYLNMYPEGKYTHAAKGLIADEKRRIAEAEAKRKEEARRVEIEQAKQAQELTQQKAEADEQAWQIAYASQSIVGYDIYLNMYPEGKYTNAAKGLIADEKRRIAEEAKRKEEARRAAEFEQAKREQELAKQKAEAEAQRKAEAEQRQKALAARIIEGAIGHRYEVIGDGSTVKDLNTGLVWQRYSVGQSWNGSTCVGEAKNFTFDEAQKLAKDGWRVPTVRELFSLVESSSGQIGKYEADIGDGGSVLKNGCLGGYQSPTINAQAFPSTPSLWFWTSSIYSGGSSSAWDVNFGYGSVSFGLRTNALHVRLVR